MPLMPVLLFLVALLLPLHSNGQDTTRAYTWYKMGNNALKHDRFDSSAMYFELAAREYLAQAQRLPRREAAPLYERAMMSDIRVVGARSLNLDSEKTLKLYKEVEDEISSLLGDTTVPMVWLTFQRARLYFEMEDFVRAEAGYKRSLGLGLAVYGDQHRMIATLNERLGEVYEIGNDLRKPDHAKALACFEKAYAIRKQFDTPRGKADQAEVLNLIGSVYFAKKDFPKSLETHLSAAKLYESLGEDYAREAGYTYNFIAYCYQNLGDKVKAEEYMRRSAD
jgi:tetratricopeptide (TPR) repeat protein